MNKLNGYVLDIYNNGEIVERVDGFREVYPTQRQMYSDTYFDIASLTKTYTATLVFVCYEENLIDLDSKIFDIDSNFSNLKDISVKDLLCHNQEIWTDGYIGDAKSVEEYKRILYSSYVKSDIPKYIDVHYIILGFLLEKIYGKSLKELYIEKIINKLDLKETKFEVTSNVASTNYENFVDNGNLLGEIHDTKARLLSKLNICTGHASIFCTGSDLLKFLVSFLDNSLLKKDTMELMLKHYDINKYNKDNNTECKTYTFMGTRYYNDINSLNDVPVKGNVVSFSGFTGPRYLIDFDRKIIIVLMCSCLHCTKLNREERFNTTKEIVFDEYYKVVGR